MTSNETHPAGQENQEKYETTVLDFLDKQMAAVQPTVKKDEQLDELNALVSDLLKQVINESDKPQDGSKLLDENKPLFDEQDELFSGLKSAPEETAVPEPKAAEPGQDMKPEQHASSVAQPEIEPEAKPDESAATQDPIFKLAKTAAVPVFSSSQAVSRKKVPLIAAAAAGLLLVIGAAIYFFSGSSGNVKNAPVSQPAGTQSMAEVLKSAPAPVGPDAQPVASTPKTGKSAVPAKPSPVSSAPAKQPASGTIKPPEPSKTAPAQQAKPAPLKDRPEPVPATAVTAPPPPVNEEKPAAVQPAQPTPPPVAAAVVEKPVADSPAPAAPERKPAVSTPAPAPVAESPAPAAQPAAPPVPRNLIPATPLSQASPAYPELAVRARASGTVVLEIQIDEQGKVVKATPISGPAIFHNAAITAAMKWRYKPASIGGVNVRSQSRVTMDFNLKK